MTLEGKKVSASEDEWWGLDGFTKVVTESCNLDTEDVLFGDSQLWLSLVYCSHQTASEETHTTTQELLVYMASKGQGDKKSNETVTISQDRATWMDRQKDHVSHNAHKSTRNTLLQPLRWLFGISLTAAF